MFSLGILSMETNDQPKLQRGDLKGQPQRRAMRCHVNVTWIVLAEQLAKCKETVLEHLAREERLEPF